VGWGLKKRILTYFHSLWPNVPEKQWTIAVGYLPSHYAPVCPSFLIVLSTGNFDHFSIEDTLSLIEREKDLPIYPTLPPMVWNDMLPRSACDNKGTPIILHIPNIIQGKK